jgi:hypothetical protein
VLSALLVLAFSRPALPCLLSLLPLFWFSQRRAFQPRSSLLRLLLHSLVLALLVLARVRLSELPAEVLSRVTPAAKSGQLTPAPAVSEKPAPYARLVRQSLIDEVPREIAFHRDDLLIGRGEDCDVIIPHALISREHARVKKLTPGYVLFDLQSRNGTYVNGRPIVENLLKEGMVVRIGEVEFIFSGASASLRDARPRPADYTSQNRLVKHPEGN